MLALGANDAGAQSFELTPPPPGARTDRPAERPRLSNRLDGGRLRLAVGAQALTVDGSGARGFEQLANVGVPKPRVALRLSFEGRWRLGDWVQLGASAGFDWTRSAQDDLDAPIDAEPRTSALRTGYLEAVLFLGVSHTIAPSSTVDAGLRLAGGGGVSSWVWDGEPDLGALYRMSGSLDVTFLFGVESADGIGLRVGYAHARCGPFGALDLSFDLSGAFLDVGYTHGW